jgi:hypothetical protein
MRTRWALAALLVVAASACGTGEEGAAPTGTSEASTSVSVTAQPTSSFPVIDERELMLMSEP